MPWITFFATPPDLLDVVETLVFAAGGRVYESYSRFDEPAREFASRAALGEVADREALAGLQLGLWLPEVGPAPRVHRITLRPGAVAGHTHRFAVEGCSLLTLHCGGLRADVVEASSLGWWTEASARAKAAPELRADAVDWTRLSALGRRAQRLIRRDLARAMASGRPVLAGALREVQGGAAMRDPLAPAARFVLATV